MESTQKPLSIRDLSPDPPDIAINDGGLFPHCLGHRHSKPNCARGCLQHDGGVLNDDALVEFLQLLHLLRVSFGVASAISASSYLPQRKPRLNTRDSFNTLTDDARIGVMHHVPCILDKVQH
jgi:hypothetical protein